MKTLLVTGAAGTVGGYVVSLAEAAGYRVVASDIDARGLRTPVRGEVRVGDLRDPATAARLVEGCDAVIHAAAQMSARADARELTRTNTEAVVHLYEAARAAGLERFVHMSTATLYASQGAALDEHAPLAPRGPYGMSKRAAEVFLQGQRSGPAWTILRAAPIYGRRGRHFAASLLVVGPVLRLATPVLPRPSGGPEGTMVHAEDVARALLFVLEREETAGRVLNVADGDPMPLGDRIALTFDAYGLRSIPTGPLPKVTLQLGGRLFRRSGLYHSADAAVLAAWRAVVVRHGLKPALRPRLDREALTLLYEDLVVDASALRGLGWRPRFDRFESGWREVLRWYQAERWVPRYG